MSPAVLECVVNVSEGRDDSVVTAIAATGAGALLDVHSDRDHNRSVLTLAGPAPGLEEAVRAVARATLEHVDLRHHQGVHPRLGALDVVPFVLLEAGGSPVGPGHDLGPALAARDRFAVWAGHELALPCFCYGPGRTLPEVRREAFGALVPDAGPPEPHPSAGACAVGARSAMVAYNLWLTTSDVTVARAVAKGVRGPALRALGLAVGGVTQVSCNLVDPYALGPAQAYDAVRRLAREAGTELSRAELVGLVPAAVVEGVPAAPPRCLGPGSRAHCRGSSVGAPLLLSRHRLGAGGGSGLRAQEAEAVAAARRLMARARRRRRRSRSESPPQIPNFSPLASAYSRQSSRTTQPRQTSFASRVEAPRSGKNRSGSTPIQLALDCQSRSWMPYNSETASTGTSSPHHLSGIFVITAV